MEENSKKIDSILADFKSENTETVIAAIKENRKEGNVKTFKALLNLLKETDEPTIEANIIEFLYDLKDEESASILIEAIESKEYEFYHNFLVAAFWQSALDASPYIEQLVKAAIDGEYMTTLECLTVIENFDSAFNEMDLLDYETDLIIAIEAAENEDKKLLLESLVEVIRKLPIEGE
jgi:hypothetical protein